MLSDSTKKFLISAGRTLLAVFITTLTPAITSGGLSWTWSFWVPIIAALVNATARLLTDPSIPTEIGGSKA